MLKAILLLPCNVLISIPLLISYFGGFEIIGANNVFLLLLMFVLFAGGLVLMIWTMTLFAQVGKGSPAPWNPINKLITGGPYLMSEIRCCWASFCFWAGSAYCFKVGHYFIICWFLSELIWFIFRWVKKRDCIKDTAANIWNIKETSRGFCRDSRRIVRNKN